MHFLKRHIEISLILMVGLIIRLFISFTHTYSNDELSAVNRLDFNNFSDLIEFGVMKGDMHPAGVQVFMKAWSLVVGSDEGFMRLPFVILSVLSIILIYKIGLKWINKNTGVIAALFLAFLYFPLLNSEFARPYSPGLFFSLLAAWYYLKVLFGEKRSYFDAIALGIAFAGAMYTHHFAFMFVGWMGVSGLIFAKKENIRFIIVSGLLALVLYIPHIVITKYQLDVGGLQWLAPPDSDWLLQFLFHAFNESFFLCLLVIQFVIMAFIFRDKDSKWSKQLTFFSILFFGIYIVGHVYSYVSTPVLKYPVMLFPLPFFLLVLGFLLSQFKMQKALLIVLSIGLLFSTILEKDLFGNHHYELFKEVSDDILKWEDQYGEDNIYTVYNLNNPNYMNFYANQEQREINFDWDVLEFGDAETLREDLKNRSEEYLIIGYSARLTLLQVFETCKEFYPVMIDGQEYNNSAVYLLSKKGEDRIHQQEDLLALFSPELENEEWIYDSSRNTVMKDSLSGYNIIRYNMAEFGPEFKFNKNEIPKVHDKYLKVIVKGEVPEMGKITASVSARKNGQVIQHRGENYWEGRDLEIMMKDTGVGYFTFKIPEFISDSDELIISLWNRDTSQEIFIDAVEIRVLDNIWN